MYSMDIMGPNLWVSVYKSYGRYDSSASWPFVLEHWTDSFKTKVNIFIGSAAKVVAVPNAPHKHLKSINPNEISHKEDSFSPVSISKVFSLTTHQKNKQTTHTHKLVFIVNTRDLPQKVKIWPLETSNEGTKASENLANEKRNLQIPSMIDEWKKNCPKTKPISPKNRCTTFIFIITMLSVWVCAILLSCSATGITRPLGLGEVPFFFNMLSVFFRCYLV